MTLELDSLQGWRVMTDEEQVKFFEEQIKRPIHELDRQYQTGLISKNTLISELFCEALENIMKG